MLVADSISTPTDSDAQAYNAIRNLLDGGPPNGIAPAGCGRWAEHVQALYEAHVAGGVETVRRVFDVLSKTDRPLAALVASYMAHDDPLAGLRHFSIAELLAMELKEPAYVVEPAIPEGTSLLAAKPKIGKTLLAQNVSLAIASGGRALGMVPVEQGRVLFLALEGSLNGMQRRFKTMLQGEKAPANLHIVREFPKLDDGGLERLRAILEHYDDLLLVVIDTLKRIRSKGKKWRNIYDVDYEDVYPITALGEEMGVSFLLIHHLNSRSEGDLLDLVSGSTGLTAAVDNVLVMTKVRGQIDAKLTVVPREEEEAELALTFDRRLCTWILAGDAADFAKTKERQRLLDVLRKEVQTMQVKDIAAAVGDKPKNVSALLRKMLEEENSLITSPNFGFYALASDGSDGSDGSSASNKN